MKKILVVDDEVQICEIFEETLVAAGHDVSVANSGEEAYTLYSQNDFDIILTDLNMPGMSGDELCWKIRSENTAIPIIAITGYYQSWDSIHFEEIGFTDYIHKPARIEDLLKLVAKYAGNN